MEIKMFVDVKEKEEFIEVLKKNNVPFEMKNLDVGDFSFFIGEQNVLIIERKTINDLAASLNDGRYREQKVRLKNCGVKVLYLIEGDYDIFKRNNKYNKILNEEKFKSCIINTMVRDNVGVYKTRNMDESAEFFNDLLKRLPTYESHIKEHSSYESNVKVKKKENVTGRVCYLNQLRQITGVSLQIAEKICETYPTMKKLIDALSDTETGGNKKLENLMLNEKRRLGPVVSSRIYDYLCKDEE
jgi:crossover junction endonuclease MUS81